MNESFNVVIALFVVAVIGLSTYFLSFHALQAIDRMLWGISVHLNDQSILTRRRDPITGRPTQPRPTASQSGCDEGVRSPARDFSCELFPYSLPPGGANE